MNPEKNLTGRLSRLDVELRIPPTSRWQLKNDTVDSALASSGEN